MCICRCLLLGWRRHHRCYYQQGPGCPSFSSLQCQVGILTFEKKKKAWRRLESSSWQALNKAPCTGLGVTDLGSCSGFAFTGHVSTDKSLSFRFLFVSKMPKQGVLACWRSPFPGNYLILSPLGKSEMQSRYIYYRAIITSLINAILINIK